MASSWTRWLAVGALAATAAGCVPRQRIGYSLQGIPRAQRSVDAVLGIAVVEDLRRTVPENRAVFERPRTFESGGRVFCARSAPSEPPWRRAPERRSGPSAA